MVDFHHFIPHNEVSTACSPLDFSERKFQAATLRLMTSASIFYSSMTYAKVKRRALYLLFLNLSTSNWTNSMWRAGKKKITLKWPLINSHSSAFNNSAPFWFDLNLISVKWFYSSYIYGVIPPEAVFFIPLSVRLQTWRRPNEYTHTCCVLRPSDDASEVTVVWVEAKARPFQSGAEQPFLVIITQRAAVTVNLGGLIFISFI